MAYSQERDTYYVNVVKGIKNKHLKITSETDLVTDTEVNFLYAVILDYFNALCTTGVVIKSFSLDRRNLFQFFSFALFLFLLFLRSCKTFSAERHQVQLVQVPARQSSRFVHVKIKISSRRNVMCVCFYFSLLLIAFIIITYLFTMDTFCQK